MAFVMENSIKPKKKEEKKNNNNNIYFSEVKGRILDCILTYQLLKRK